MSSSSSAHFFETALPGTLPPEERAPLPKGTWVLQRSARPKGWYYQAVFGSGQDRVTVGIGILSDDAAENALANLRTWGARLLTVGNDGVRLCDNAAIKAAALGAPLALDPTALDHAIDAEVARKAVLSRDYTRMTLQDFVEHLWGPVRRQTNVERTWKAEWGGVWKPSILPVLGHLRLSSLDAHRWQQFLAANDHRWSGRMKSYAQNAYLCALNYAKKIGAIETVHGVEKIRGASKRTEEPGEALTAEEVQKLLDVAKPVHRALFAMAFGLGLRPSEVVRLEWSHIRWEKGTVKIMGTKNKQAEAVVALTAACLPELKSWWEKCGKPATGPVFVFRGKAIRDWREALKGAVERSGIDPDGTRKIMPYSARYTYATLGIVGGVNEAAMRRGMRHAYASRVMETVYQRLNEDQLVEQMASFPAFGRK